MLQKLYISLRYTSIVALSLAMLTSCDKTSDEFNPLLLTPFMSSLNGSITSCTTCKIYEAINGGSQYSMNLGGISGADTKCNTDPDKPSGGGIYKAFLVDGVDRIASVTANTGDGQVSWVLKASTTYYQADGTTMIGSTGSTALFNFPLSIASNPFNIASSAYFTGMDVAQDWTSSSNNCSRWTDDTTGSTGTISAGASDAGILSDGSSTPTCNTPGPIICVEQ